VLRKAVTVARDNRCDRDGLKMVPGSPVLLTLKPNWDAMARCESGGKLVQPNTGNGLLTVGLQFTPAHMGRERGCRITPPPRVAIRQIRGLRAKRCCRPRDSEAWPVLRRSNGVWRLARAARWLAWIPLGNLPHPVHRAAQSLPREARFVARQQGRVHPPGRSDCGGLVQALPAGPSSRQSR